MGCFHGHFLKTEIGEEIQKSKCFADFLHASRADLLNAARSIECSQVPQGPLTEARDGTSAPFSPGGRHPTLREAKTVIPLLRTRSGRRIASEPLASARRTQDVVAEAG